MPLSRILSKPAPKEGMHTVYDAPNYAPYVGNGLPQRKQKSLLETQPRDPVVVVQKCELTTSDSKKSIPPNSATTGQPTISSPFRSSPKNEVDPTAATFSSGFPPPYHVEKRSASTARYQQVRNFDAHLHTGTAPLSSRYSGVPLSRRNSRAIILRRRSKVLKCPAEPNDGAGAPTLLSPRASQRIIH